MDKLDLNTPDFTNKNIEKIIEFFPEVATESIDADGNIKKAIDFDKLRQVLSNDAIEGKERYEFTWVGKKEAMIDANTPIRKTLRPIREDSKNWETTGNIYIEGDNLEALKILQNSYLGKVKMIYIDPPYNTGNDFIYNDSFKMTEEDYEESMEMYDEAGDRLFKNTYTNGRFHSDWCSMIYPRLKLARNLLSDDGVIFISIDDNEQDNLKKICDEIFGEENFIGNVIRLTSPQRFDQEKNINVSHDLILAICKSSSTNLKKAIINIETKKILKKDCIGYYYEGDTKAILADSSKGYSKGGDYDFTYNGKIYKPVDSNGKRNRWLWTYDRMKAAAELGILIETPSSLRMQIYQDKKFDDATNTMIPKEPGLRLKSTEFVSPNYSNPSGKSDLKYLEMDNFFSNPKPIELLYVLSQISTDKNDIILDFFSGSATTAHSTMQLNADDGGNRKFIMVQLPESTDEKSEAYKAGYKYITEIGKERIRRAGEKILADNADKEGIEDLDVGFRVFRVDDNIQNEVFFSPGDLDQMTLEATVSNIKEDRNDLDLLFASLLAEGVPIGASYESIVIDGYLVHNYDDGALVACFEDDIPADVINKIASIPDVERVIFRDSSFVDSPAKLNAKEIFKSIAPTTEIKVL